MFRLKLPTETNTATVGSGAMILREMLPLSPNILEEGGTRHQPPKNKSRQQDAPASK